MMLTSRRQPVFKTTSRPQLHFGAAHCFAALTATVLFFAHNLAIAQVTDTGALVEAINNGQPGDTIEIAAGTYELSAPLEPKAGMTLKGAGMDQTVITHVPSWKPSVKTLPDPEMRTQGMDTRAYLIRLVDKAPDITITGLTLLGPQMHGGIFGNRNENLRVQHVRIQPLSVLQQPCRRQYDGA